MNKILIIIDMQNDFVTGSLGSPAAEAVIPKIREKIEYEKTKGTEIFYTKDTHYANYSNTQEGKKLPVPHCIINTSGWEIVPEIAPENEKNVIKKESFGYGEWKAVLPMTDKIELVGVCTDICVVSNALILKALYPETQITVDAECCAGTSVEAHEAALTVMKSCQINIENE